MGGLPDEWVVRLAGDLGRLGTEYEVLCDDEAMAHLRVSAWKRTRPDVSVSLFCRSRQVVYGDWTEVPL